MTRECITHHHACDCREAQFAELQLTVNAQQDTIGALKRKLSLADAEAEEQSRLIDKQTAQIAKLRSIVNGVHGALADAGDIVVPGSLNADLRASVMRIVERRDAAKVECDALDDAIFQISVRLGEVRESDMDDMSWHTQLIARTQWMANQCQRIESAPIYHIPTGRPTSEEGWLNVIDSVKAINDMRGKHVRLVVEDGE